MKYVLICFCFIFLLPYSFQMKNERYEMFAKKLFSSVQSYFGNVTHVSDNNNIIMLSFTNVKLINPILSKISYTYNETRPFYFTAKNVIFTFVSDVYSTISTYNAKSIMISRASFGGFDFFGQGASGFDSSSYGSNDEHMSITISLADAINGASKTIRGSGGEVNFKIPSGIQNGEKLRLKGKAARGADIILSVNIASDEVFERDGDDLKARLEVPLKTALFGGSVSFKTHKKEVSLKIAAGTKNGQKIRLKGYGVPNRKSGLIGDLYLEVSVILPEISRLSPELVELLKKEL